MAGEVKRISLEYNEEKQKLDLMMKIQQARQRQSLQRKLFEKSQRKAQQQHQQVRTGHRRKSHWFSIFGYLDCTTTYCNIVEMYNNISQYIANATTT